jgi:hypothetical protein
MLAPEAMLEEADRLAHRYELRLEQLRLYAACVRDPAVLDSIRRQENALRELQQLRAEIIRDILSNKSIEMT